MKHLPILLVLLILISGCRPPGDTSPAIDWRPLVAYEAARATVAGSLPQPAPGPAPSPSPTCKECGGTGWIKQGDGNETECPFCSTDEIQPTGMLGDARELLRKGHELADEGKALLDQVKRDGKVTIDVHLPKPPPKDSYRAPVPDSSSKQIPRLPGPRHGWPCGCTMCLGNHLLGSLRGSTHRVPSSVLNRIGSRQWQLYHDNLHNAKADLMFVPTPQDVVERMLALAGVTERDVVYDLGCGDGRIVVAAAKQYGCRAVGIELDPELVQVARQNARAQGVERLVTIEQGDVLDVDLRPASVVALYLFPELNAKLVPQLARLRPGARIVSHAHAIPGVRTQEVVRMRSLVDGLEHAIFVWDAPLTFSQKGPKMPKSVSRIAAPSKRVAPAVSPKDRDTADHTAGVRLA